MCAEQDRIVIIERVAEGIWNSNPDEPSITWRQACLHAQHPAQIALAHEVDKTRAAARAAIKSLMIGASPRHEDVRLAMAGEHASGVVGGLCVEIFDAMLAEVLE
ncbi:hypothetical protein [Brevundimonas diminuta]|uniref:hypothetical protein n=1 Tax=Brevundimonas diminuta TaxID=293 RepID=UPI0030FB8BF9